MHISILPSTVSDNFMYVLQHDDLAVVVDPIDHHTVLDFLAAQDLCLKGIVNTHWHPDHVCGNMPLLKHVPNTLVYAPQRECERIADLTGRVPDVALVGGATIRLADMTFDVVDIPGHTHGHIGLLAEGHLLSGDAIFTGGAGHVRLGGDPGVLFTTFRDVLRVLPEHTLFYPGHNYAVHNLAFSLSVLPNLRAAQVAHEEFTKHPARELKLSTLGKEREHNLFMRFDDPELLDTLTYGPSQHLFLAQAAYTHDPHEQVFRTLRALRDIW